MFELGKEKVKKIKTWYYSTFVWINNGIVGWFWFHIYTYIKDVSFTIGNILVLLMFGTWCFWNRWFLISFFISYFFLINVLAFNLMVHLIIHLSYICLCSLSRWMWYIFYVSNRTSLILISSKPIWAYRTPLILIPSKHICAWSRKVIAWLHDSQFLTKI